MLKQLYYIVPAMLCCYLTARAQQSAPDTTSRESLDEVVVTATCTPRSEKDLEIMVFVANHSLEIFDAKGNLVVQFFGKRKPGAAELPAWTEFVTGLQ